jgi:hypothetical protein
MEAALTYPPTPEPDGTYPIPPDPPVQPYQPPQSNPPYQAPQSSSPYQQPGYHPYAPAQSPYPPLPSPYAPQPGPSQYDYGYPGSPYAYSQYAAIRRPTDGLAVASLVVSIVSVLGLCAWWIGGVVGILGAIFGHVARRRIRSSGAAGAGMALAGIIVGWVVAALAIIGAVAAFVFLLNDPSLNSDF